jgi:catechol 2,3-dioxygenase-like lactoylglutathione lyase family enzyme
MRIKGLDHFNIRTHDLERLCRFYTEVLGFEEGERPPFRFPGAWLYVGGHPILHVSVTKEPPSGSTLPIDHIALEVEGYADTVERLESAGLEFRAVDVPARAMKQIFISDPDGVSIELNFSKPEDVTAAS